jgi:phage terminase large subunit-like protein
LAQRTRTRTKAKTRQKSSSGKPDAVEQYARAVLAQEIPAGPLVRAACERHLNDLQRGHERGLTWDRAKAERALRFFPAVLRLAEGQHAGQPFNLQAWEQFIVGSLFGWIAPDGFRRFRVAYIEIAKGNGKSPLAAGIGLYMFVGDREEHAEVYAAATTREQAHILFDDAVSMVNQSPHLARNIDLSGKRKVLNLAHLKSGSFFRPISSEGRSLDGKRVHCALIDELHEHPSATVVDKMRAGTKGRRQAMIVEITNSGVDRTSVCYQHHEYSERVVRNLTPDDGWFAYVCSHDEGEDPLEDPGCWAKTNPNLGISIGRKYLEEQVRESLGMPAKASLVRRLNFCQWVDAENPWIGGSVWRSVEKPLQWEQLRGRRAFGALDLSGTRDLTAFALAFPPDEDHERWAGWVHFWTPKDTLSERSKRDRVPYDVWVKDGFITATPGRNIGYEFVAQHLADMQVELQLEEVAFDPYRIKYLEKELDEQGIEVKLVPHPQGLFKSAESLLWMPRSLELLEKLVSDGRIDVAKNPVLTWNAASAVSEEDPKGNTLLTKRKSKGRIDGMIALAMAVGLASKGEESGLVLDAEQAALAGDL